MPYTPLNDKFDFKQDSFTLLTIALISFVQSLAINGLYVPHGFLSGGISGLSLLIHYTTGLPGWIFIVLLNIPVMIVGWKFMRGKFIIFSILATVLFSLSFALTEGFSLNVENPIISGLAGAAILGITGAPVVKRGASLGGMDVLALILSRKYSFPMGTFNIMFNLFIMSMLVIFSSLELALMSMLAMFISNTAFNYAMQGLNRSNTVFIISDKWEQIAPTVLKELHRGVTYIPAKGAFTGKDRILVYCIVKTTELSALRRIVKTCDENALFSIIETKEVVGRGFGALN
ncbi:MAG: hypothetical protein BWY11_01608 [Firmicutes bacterium ADurb.Bin182]|nr:MAG: hypothetical protein BWY11_01608 [Firmicutes bacterium ADurb.Bin182]